MLGLFLVYVFILGALIGSFLNCLIWRLYKREGLWNRSYCPHCRHQIAWYDNIPVLSFLFLRGRCRYCHIKISWQYPLVELSTAILFLISFWINYHSLTIIPANDILGFIVHNSRFIIQTLRDFFLIAVMTLIFIYDLRWYLILDRVTLPACALAFITNLILGYDWKYLLLAGVIGAGFFLIQFLISRGKWMGGGDIRLGLLMGLALGWPNILAAIFLAYILGSLVGIFLLWLNKKKMGSQVPLGTFLSVATIVVLFWGDLIVSWYLRWSGF